MTNDAIDKLVATFNIAFLTFDGDEKSLGGVQRVTYTLVEGFKKRGIKSFLISNRTFEKPADFFEEKMFYCGPECNEQLDVFIKENAIRLIINNGVVGTIQTGAEIRAIIDRCDCKMVSIIHSKPDLMKIIPSLNSLIHDIRYSKCFFAKLFSLVKILSFPIYKKLSNKKYIAWRKRVFDNSDRVIVLSKYYIDGFCRMIGEQSEKVVSIPNPLSYEEFCTEALFDTKVNEVLVVSRLEEPVKGLSKVFKAWKIIEEKYPDQDWQLTIVGDGNDASYYQNLCKKLGLTKVSFEGYQRPYEYYKRAKLFIMSSNHEGLPTTMLEAEQMGMAVIAINNFESLGDLVSDGINGYLIEDSIITLAEKMWFIMKNPELCKQYAMASVENSSFFQTDRIINQWIQLINDLENEE